MKVFAFYPENRLFSDRNPLIRVDTPSKKRTQISLAFNALMSYHVYCACAIIGCGSNMAALLRVDWFDIYHI